MNMPLNDFKTFLSMGGFVGDWALQEAKSTSTETALRIAKLYYDPHQIEYWQVVKAVQDEEMETHFYNYENVYLVNNVFLRWFFKQIGFFEKEKIEQADYIQEMENCKSTSPRGMGLYNCISLPERYVLYLMDKKGMSVEEIAKLPVFKCKPQFIDGLAKGAQRKFSMNSTCKVDRKIIWEKNTEEKEKNQ